MKSTFIHIAKYRCLSSDMLRSSSVCPAFQSRKIISFSELVVFDTANCSSECFAVKNINPILITGLSLKGMPFIGPQLNNLKMMSTYNVPGLPSSMALGIGHSDDLGQTQKCTEALHGHSLTPCPHNSVHIPWADGLKCIKANLLDLERTEILLTWCWCMQQKKK